MDCSICFDAIAASTGSATLSCGHQYHLGCIARWLMTNESCPYCRHSPTEHERIAQPSNDEEEDEGSDMSDEDDRSSASLDIPAFDDECHALWVLRETFEMLERGESLEPVPADAAPVQERCALYSVCVSRAIENIRHRQNRLDLYLGDDRGYESA